MVALISLFVVVFLSLLVTRVATVALTFTGLSRESARFQARSAFSGAGFTTTESESVVTHPVRRRIILNLILLGNAGVVSSVTALLLSFAEVNTTEGVRRVLLLLMGLGLLWVLASSRLMEWWLERVIRWALGRFTDLEVRDYAGLLHLSEQWMVVELSVGGEDWLANHTLAELDLPDEGVLVLGISRKTGRWVGAPKGTAPIFPGDTLLLYGPRDTLKDLDERPVGLEAEARRRASRERFARMLEQQEEVEAKEVGGGQR